ncbi:MAG: 50S ribosomal protein L22 [Clostridia bacterium]|nr:50S ribosomal protein L22 [Clostridia bacterium]
MESRAYVRNVRISPSKVKIVCDLIRGKKASEAAAILRFTPKAASEPLSKLLKNAVANAENNYEMDVEKLYVSEVFVGPGPIMKRILPRAKGRADRINKRTSHITLAVKELDAE